MNQPELGRRILELRQSLGLTQGELAENCQLSLRTVQRIESAEVTPRSHTIRALLSYLDEDYLSSDIPLDVPKDERGTRIWLEQFLKYVLELFNLKTNTMKKLSVLSLMVILITAGMLHSNDTNAQKIEGWFMKGSHPTSYDYGLDKSVHKTGSSSAFMESKEKKIKGFGTLMQVCTAADYLGKRIKMTAYVKAENVTQWAGMWLRIDGKGKRLGFDNMQDRPIHGTCDWTKCEIILDVPENSLSLNYGVLLSGTGKIWFDNVSFEVVDKLVATPTNKLKLPAKPRNLDFGN